MLKTPKLRSEKYRRWVASLPCITCGVEGSTQAAHVRKNNGGGMGLKPSDEFCLPLCVTCHHEQHAKGEIRFWGRNLERARFTTKILYGIYKTNEPDRDTKAKKMIGGFL